MTPSAVPYPPVASDPVLQWGENVAALLDQRRTEGAHPLVRVDVLLVDRERLREQDLLRIPDDVRRDPRACVRAPTRD